MSPPLQPQSCPFVFKFMEWKYAERILDGSGYIRISPFGTWSDEARFGSLVGDSSEGTVRQSLSVERVTEENYDEMPKFFRDVFFGGTMPRNGLLENVGTGYTYDSRHFFAFCVGKEYSRRLQQRWFQEEGYDCCLRIHNGYGFFNQLDEAFQRLRRSECIGTSITPSYSGVISTDFLRHPCFYKHEKYSDLNEVRIVWRPKEVEPQKPIDIPASDFSQFFSIVDRI